MHQIKILFVEDEADIREELSGFLKRFAQGGLYVAQNGEEGLSLFREQQPDIVVTDIKMPKMNGIEMVKEIKKEYPEQSILFTTAHSDSTFFLEAIELQVDGYLLKPVDLKQLRHKVKKISKELALQREYASQKIILNEIAYLQGSMLAVLDKEFNLLFLNDRGLAFWGMETLKEALAQNAMITSRMIKDEEYFYPSDDRGRAWITEIQTLEPHKRVIALRSLDGKSIHTYMVDISYSKETEHTIIALSEITKIEQERTSYRRRMYIDDLTQTYNRAMFDKQMDIEIKKALKEGKELSMIMLDIDHFKQVNDQHGHMVGDEVLIGVSDLVRNNIRIHDLFARWGGEEFVLLLPDTGIEGARKLAESLRKRIEAHTFFKGISLTCSFGVASVKAVENICLFRKADEALYKAKLQGRNKVVNY